MMCFRRIVKLSDWPKACACSHSIPSCSGNHIVLCWEQLVPSGCLFLYPELVLQACVACPEQVLQRVTRSNAEGLSCW